MNHAPQILEGRPVAARVCGDLAERVDALGRSPRLAIIRVGEDPRSAAYIGRKQAFAEEIGAEVALQTLPESATQAELEVAVVAAGADDANDGVILQLPAANLDGYSAAALVPPGKDVDGLAPGSPFVSATALAVAELLDAHGVGVEGKRVAVVGQSRLAGAPIAELMRERGAIVSTADDQTVDLASVTLPAEIVVSAVGKPGLLTAAHLSPGATVIDVGTTAGSDGKLLGDLAASACPTLAAYSPVPGGVGPLTVAMLLSNLVLAAERRT